MNILNRKKQPQTKPVGTVNFPVVEKHDFKNGLPVHIINAGAQEVAKIDLIFEAGRWNCEKPIVADFTNRMLIEGSNSFNPLEIAEKLDYYGAFINFECGKHFANLQLYCPSNFVEKCLPIIANCIKKPTFPEQEFNVHLKNEYQQFMLSREKTEVLAAEAFYRNIFGKDHPYGKARKQDDFKNLQIDELKKHHQRYYNPANCKIIVAGKLNKNMLAILEEHFGSDDWPIGEAANKKKVHKQQTSAGRELVKKNGASQASIKLGKATIDKKNPDFRALGILNTVLGGYYGSRLMANLREKNGLTYGVYSSLSALLKTGVFSISTNVNIDQVDFAIEQINNEINVLKEKLIPEKELEMVKNYLSGDMLQVFDGPLPTSEIYANLLNFGLGFEYYNNYFELLKTVDPNLLRDLANKYFGTDGFVEVVVS